MCFDGTFFREKLMEVLIINSFRSTLHLTDKGASGAGKTTLMVRFCLWKSAQIFC